MKKLLFLSAVAVATLTSCGSKLGELSADNFKVVPNPLITEAGQVPATINGMFPEKYMAKKAVVTVTPELRFTENGTEKAVQGQSATFQGEKVLGNDQTISYKVGGNYTMKANFAYQPAMQKSDLYLVFDARIGKKQKVVEVPAVKVATGVIATSELYRSTVADAQPCTSQDAYQRVNAQKYDATIKFLIQQANLRKSELKNNSVKEFTSLLKRIAKEQETLNINNVEISAYASPDGGVTLNEKLANQRQQNTEKYVKQQMKLAKVNTALSAQYTAQDWEGFQELVQASNIQDKEVILRVLSMYKDPQEREQQIKNMSQGFRELADNILPELRRARLTINYETIGRSDDQILAQYKEDPSKLSVEELLYGAAITKDDSQREDILKTTANLYRQDSRATNNLAVLAMQKGNSVEAQKYLNQARSIDSKNAEANANLGMLALQNGDVKTAEDYISRAAGANNLSEALGNLHLAQGNYALAQQDFAGINSNSAALAQLLNKDYASAAKTLANVKNANGMTDYLNAIVNARQGNNDVAATYLRSAIQKDPKLAQYAANDLELSAVNK